jgi:hypothetical protein
LASLESILEETNHQILALPVFRVSRVGYPLSSLARRCPPSSYIRPMGVAHSKPMASELNITVIVKDLESGTVFWRPWRVSYYQFFAYLAWATPFLLWRAGVHPVLIYALWALQEWAWNVFPCKDLAHSKPMASELNITVIVKDLESGTVFWRPWRSSLWVCLCCIYPCWLSSSETG